MVFLILQIKIYQHKAYFKFLIIHMLLVIIIYKSKKKNFLIIHLYLYIVTNYGFLNYNITNGLVNVTENNILYNSANQSLLVHYINLNKTLANRIIPFKNNFSSFNATTLGLNYLDGQSIQVELIQNGLSVENLLDLNQNLLIKISRNYFTRNIKKVIINVTLVKKTFFYALI